MHAVPSAELSDSPAHRRQFRIPTDFLRQNSRTSPQQQSHIFSNYDISQCMNNEYSGSVINLKGGTVVWYSEYDLWFIGHGFGSQLALLCSNLMQVVHTLAALSSSSIMWYWPESQWQPVGWAWYKVYYTVSQKQVPTFKLCNFVKS